MANSEWRIANGGMAFPIRYSLFARSDRNIRATRSQAATYIWSNANWTRLDGSVSWVRSWSRGVRERIQSRWRPSSAASSIARSWSSANSCAVISGSAVGSDSAIAATAKGGVNDGRKGGGATVGDCDIGPGQPPLGMPPLDLVVGDQPFDQDVEEFGCHGENEVVPPTGSASRPETRDKVPDQVSDGQVTVAMAA